MVITDASMLVMVIVLMMFVLFCHQLDNIHVRGNYIPVLFARMIESL